MMWLDIDIDICSASGAMRIIGFIDDSVVIAKILSHLDAKAPKPEQSMLPVHVNVNPEDPL